MFKTQKEASKEDTVWECVNVISDNGNSNFTETEFTDALSNTKYFDDETANKEFYKWERIGRITLNQDGSYRK